MPRASFSNLVCTCCCSAGRAVAPVVLVRAITRDDIECAGRTWRSWRVDGHYPAGIGSMVAWVTDQHPLGVLKIRSALKPKGVDERYTYVYVSHGSD